MFKGSKLPPATFDQPQGLLSAASKTTWLFWLPEHFMAASLLQVYFQIILWWGVITSSTASSLNYRKTWEEFVSVHHWRIFPFLMPFNTLGFSCQNLHYSQSKTEGFWGFAFSFFCLFVSDFTSMLLPETWWSLLRFADPAQPSAICSDLNHRAKETIKAGSNHYFWFSFNNDMF